MELERRLRKVTYYHLALFLLPMLSLLYYGWWVAPTLDQRPDNPLRLSPMALRGDIKDRTGKPLAHSVEQDRLYPLKEAAGPLVGYHLRGRNQSGLEALLQNSLSPPSPPKSLWGALAMDRQRRAGHPALKGPDAVLTLDAALQEAIYRAFSPRHGAVVVARGEGEILAAVSGPSFDPNGIGRDWQILQNDPGSPLIERVGGGLYPVRRLDGGELLSGQKLEGHPWLSDNPFPGFPGASSAVLLQESLLISPLMLLQMAGQKPSETTPRPRLLAEEEEDAVDASPFAVPLPGTGSRSGEFELFTLLGPKFLESPPFQVLLGRRVDGSAMTFAVVIEAGSEADTALFVERLLPLLQQK